MVLLKVNKWIILDSMPTIQVIFILERERKTSSTSLSRSQAFGEFPDVLRNNRRNQRSSSLSNKTFRRVSLKMVSQWKLLRLVEPVSASSFVSTSYIFVKFQLKILSRLTFEKIGKLVTYWSKKKQILICFFFDIYVDQPTLFDNYDIQHKHFYFSVRKKFEEQPMFSIWIRLLANQVIVRFGSLRLHYRQQ